jgi:aminoglycoside phosphotransferase (APT) family kinase protein
LSAPAGPIEPGLASVAAAVERARPAWAPVGELRLLSDVGWGCRAYQSESGLAVLVSRTPLREAWEMAANLLTVIGPTLPIPVPSPNLLIPAREGLDVPVLAYPMLPGRQMEIDDCRGPHGPAIATRLGAALAALHAFPLAGVPEEVERREQSGDWLLQEAEAALPTLERELSPAEYTRAAQWLPAARQDERLARYTPALRHGDLWPGNLLIDEGQVSGIIDWEDAAVGDHAIDFADLHEAGAPFMDALIEAYRAAGGVFGEDERYRARRWFEGRAFMEVDWAARQPDPALLPAAVAKFRRNPVLAGWA